MFLLFYVKRANALSLSVLINTIEDLKKDKQLSVLRHLNSLIIPLLDRDYLRDPNLPPQRFDLHRQHQAPYSFLKDEVWVWNDWRGH